LLRAAAEGIAQNGWRVFRASCHEQDRGLPFALIIDLAEEIRAAYPAETSAILEPAAEPLARLIPELGVSEEAAPSGDPEQERRRLFTAMSAVFERQASAAPCLLLVEDLHWADEGSLDFLASIARAASRVP